MRAIAPISNLDSTGIRAMHLQDERTNLSLYAWSSKTARPALPAPVQAKALSVPPDHRLRADKKECLAPSWPDAREQEPEHAIGTPKLNPPSRGLAFQDEALVTKGEDLSGSRPEKPAEHAEKRPRGQGASSTAG